MTTAGNNRPSSSAVHPIDSPPPPAPNYVVGNEPPSSGADIRTCIRAYCCPKFIIYLLIMAALGLGIIFFIHPFLRTSTPSEPWWPYLHINSLSVAVNTSPSGRVSGNWTAHITLLNKDHKKSAFYDAIDCQVLYKGERLAWTRLPPFDLGPESQTNATVALAASGLYVDDWVVGDIDADSSHGGVKFDLWFTAGVRSKALGREFSEKDRFDVYCYGLPVSLSSSSEGGREMLSGVCHDCIRDCYTQ